jgi:phosphoglycerol transferase MdoB-like AlkP superfamily enzyme
MARRGVFRFWLTVASSVVMFLGLMEMDFYREFHQRLNGLVFQYIKEDPKTVMSMLWYGFPVVRYLLAWAFGTWLLSLLFKGIDRLTRGGQRRLHARCAVVQPPGGVRGDPAGGRGRRPWHPAPGPADALG